MADKLGGDRMATKPNCSVDVGGAVYAMMHVDGGRSRDYGRSCGARADRDRGGNERGGHGRGGVLADEGGDGW